MTGTPPVHVQHADKPSNARPTSIKSMKSAVEKCSSGCCGSAGQNNVKCAEVVANIEAEGDASGYCDGSATQASPTRGDNTLAHAQSGSGAFNDAISLIVPTPAKEEPVRDGCASGCCSVEPVSVAIEHSKVDTCSDGCCGTADEPPIEDCNEGCCSTVKPEEPQKHEGENGT
jgi:hypothetical protein